MSNWMKNCKSDNILLTEGATDCRVIKKFCENNNINDKNFSFCNCGRQSLVFHTIKTILKGSIELRPNAVGIIIDADSSLSKCYEEVKQELKKYDNLPSEFPKEGLIIEQECLPKLGIWIMPNNKDKGTLEDFYLQLTDINTDFIEDVIKKAKYRNLTSFKPQHRNKAIVQTYFAWQDRPGAPLKDSLNRVELDNNKDIAIAFKKWLTDLFN